MIGAKQSPLNPARFNEEARGDRESKPVLLLGDIWRVFDSDGADFIRTTDLLEELGDLNPAWQGVGPRQLSDLLRRFGIRPKDKRCGAANVKGYFQRDFEEPWSQYGLSAATPATPATGGESASSADPATRSRKNDASDIDVVRDKIRLLREEGAKRNRRKS